MRYLVAICEICSITLLILCCGFLRWVNRFDGGYMYGPFDTHGKEDVPTLLG